MLRPKNKQKKHNSQIQIRSAQKVGKVWISREKKSGSHLGPLHIFFHRKNAQKFIFSLVGQWAYSPGFGPLLLSTLGGAIGISIFYRFGANGKDAMIDYPLNEFVMMHATCVIIMRLLMQ